MAEYKIILFYCFTPLADPEAIRLWQLSLCQTYQLKGRIILNETGINGTVGGTLPGVKSYVRWMKQYKPFQDIHFKWSEGSSDDFPKLSVKIRPELVTFEAPDRIIVDRQGIQGGGQRLSPQALHELYANKSGDVVFFDGRNKHEAAIGKFKNAVVPDITHTRDFVSALESGAYDALKDKPVVTYCTGGIRCEVLTVLMKNRGFQEVYQLDGGIVSYGEQYKDDGLWEGSLYVFDNRKDIAFSNNAKTISSCAHCQSPTSNYENCQAADCNDKMLVCNACQTTQYCPACLKKVNHSV